MKQTIEFKPALQKNMPNVGTVCLIVQQYNHPTEPKAVVRRFTEAVVVKQKRGSKRFQSIKTTFQNGAILKHVTHFTAMNNLVFLTPLEDLKFNSEFPRYKSIKQKIKG